MTVVVVVDGLAKGFEFLLILKHFSKADDVEGDVILLQLSSEGGEILLLSRNGTSDKTNDSLSLTFVVSVSEAELGDLQGLEKVGLCGDLDLWEGVEEFHGILRESNQKLGRFAGHCQHANRVFLVGVGAGLGDDADGLFLRFEAGRDVVSVSHPFRVVDAQQRGFDGHDGEVRGGEEGCGRRGRRKER